MAESIEGHEGGSFVEDLRSIQGQYMMLADLHEKQKLYGQKLAEIVKALQEEADEPIPIRPQVLGEQCNAAYLVSEAVVVMFDIHRNMASKPLHAFPANVIVSVIEECTAELGRRISEKRQAETTKVEALEKVLKKLRKANATIRHAEREEVEEEFEDPVEPLQKAPAVRAVPRAEEKKHVEESARAEPIEVKAPSRPSGESFAFSGSFGEKQEGEAR